MQEAMEQGKPVPPSAAKGNSSAPGGAKTSQSVAHENAATSRYFSE